MDNKFAQKLAKDMMDGVIKQAASIEKPDQNITMDPETKKRLIEREIRMASDPDYELGELAKSSAARRMRNNLRRGTTMEIDENKAQNAAQTATEAAGAGLNAEQATELAMGKKKIKKSTQLIFHKKESKNWLIRYLDLLLFFGRKNIPAPVFGDVVKLADT